MKSIFRDPLAHTDGGVPNIIIEIEKLDAYHFGYLVYFFFKACAMSAYLLKLILLISQVLNRIKKTCSLFWVNRALKSLQKN